MLRLRQGLREYFPAALVAFEDLASSEALELLAKAPTPRLAARLSGAQLQAALRKARRRHVAEKAARLREALRTPHLGQSEQVTAAYAATTRAQARLLIALNGEVTAMASEVATLFGQHPQAGIYLSQPGLGPVLGARVLAEFGDDSDRYRDSRARKNYAGTSPITRASGRKKVVLARYVHNDRLIDALGRQAYTALTASTGARHYYDGLRERGLNHHAALRQLANRLVGILHGCLVHATAYDEELAWAHRQPRVVA